jgi:hypothetical protein
MLVLLIILVFVLPALIIALSARLDRRRRRASPTSDSQVVRSATRRLMGLPSWSLEGLVIRDKTRKTRRGPEYDD